MKKSIIVLIFIVFITIVSLNVLSTISTICEIEVSLTQLDSSSSSWMFMQLYNTTIKPCATLAIILIAILCSIKPCTNIFNIIKEKN